MIDLGREKEQILTASTLIRAQDRIDSKPLSRGQKMIMFAGTLNQVNKTAPFEDIELVHTASVLERDLSSYEEPLVPRKTKGLFESGVKLAKKI